MARKDLYGNISKYIAEGSADKRLKQLSQIDQGGAPEVVLFRKFVIIDVIYDTDEIFKNIESYHARFDALGVSNTRKFLAVAPRNSVIAKPLEIDGGGPAMLLFPFFPSHLSFPCKPGELVWVIFERPTIDDKDVGYWISRVPDLSYVDDPNHSHFPRRWDASMLPAGARDQSEGNADPKFEFRNGVVVTNTDGERVTVSETQAIAGAEDEFEQIITNSNASQMCLWEAAPRYKKRPGDTALEGSNNTLIVLGTDRQNVVGNHSDNPDGTRATKLPDSDATTNTGIIDFVAGRGQTDDTAAKKVKNVPFGFEESDKSLQNVNANEGDPDLKNDRSRVLITVGTGKTIDVKLNEGIEELYSQVMADEPSADSDPGIVVTKSDKVRIIARSEVMIISTNFDLIDKKMVDKIDPNEFACVILKPNGDIILRPATKGVLKLGDENADRAIICSSEPATVTEGIVTHTPMIDTMSGQIGTGVGLQGTYATKILVSSS